MQYPISTNSHFWEPAERARPSFLQDDKTRRPSHRPVLRVGKLHQLDDVPVALQHRAVVLPLVREGASRAVLEAVLQIAELPAAALPQRVERTIAEKTVEALPVRPRVAGEMLALSVLREGVMLVLPVFHVVSAPSVLRPARKGDRRSYLHYLPAARKMQDSHPEAPPLILEIAGAVPRENEKRR